MVGSRSYGTNLPESDIDYKGVFILPFENFLSGNYIEQVSDETNDVTYYEIGRFLQLLKTNNPTILELVSTPEDCLIYKDPIFDLILNKKEKFITKLCKMSFGGYAVEQIKKARGLNKKIVNPIEITRKSVLDFCYVQKNQGSVPIKEYLKNLGLNQEDFGLSSIPHMKYTYGAYYLPGNSKGIIQDEEKSNDISLSSIPKDIEPNFVLQFNRDSYSIYCRDFREYQDWIKKRNPKRYSDNIKDGRGFDSKNLMHCHRLLDMSIEIGNGEGIQVRRKNFDYLLDIRAGKYDYDELVKSAEEKIKIMNETYDNSDLPENIDENFIDELVLKIRKEFYQIK